VAQAITVSIDARSAQLALGRIGAQQRQRARQWLREQGEAIRTASMELCPVVTGNLRSSAQTYSEHGGDTVIVGYGNSAVKYAARTHENPRAGQTGGVSPSGRAYPDGTFSTVGQWKWLEVSFLRLMANASSELAAVLRTGR
jgi:hypothetical protein